MTARQCIPSIQAVDKGENYFDECFFNHCKGISSQCCFLRVHCDKKLIAKHLATLHAECSFYEQMHSVVSVRSMSVVPAKGQERLKKWTVNRCSAATYVSLL